MLLTKRYRNIIALFVMQALVFVLYTVRLHFFSDGRAAAAYDYNSIQWMLSSEELQNITTTVIIQVNTTEDKYRTKYYHHIATAGDARLGVSSDHTTGQWSVQSVTSSDHLVTDITSMNAKQFTDTDSSVTNTATHNNNSETKNRLKMRSASNLNYAGDTLVFPPPNNMSSECVQSFLKAYSKYCNVAIVPLSLKTENASVLCSCIPDTLIGYSKPSFNGVTLKQTEAEHPELSVGGHWSPTSCVARQRIAIIVPFRDRESHLKVFLRVLHPFLQRQLLDYTVFVVEQERPAIFNKASLMNAGFLEIRSRYQIDCFIFHDVDMLPEDDRNFYGCYKSPRHVGAYVDKHKYNLLYVDIFGGATAFTEKHFLTLNGYSNEFYGWGGEDDDMFNRVKWTHLNYLRFPKCVARYTMIKHKRDKSNPYIKSLANRAWKMRPQVYRKNGLNSVSYRLVNVEKKPLYTRILIALDEPSMHENQTSTTTNSTS